MTGPGKNVLLITPDKVVAQAIEKALSDMEGVKIRSVAARITALNGKAGQLAADKDIIIFDASSDDGPDMEAIRDLVAARRSGAKLLALADAQMTLSQIHALNRAGVDAVLPAPTNGEDAGELAKELKQMRREGMQAYPGAAPGQPRGRVIAVAKARGGVGATTVAVNLADELIARGGFLTRREPNAVAILDLDVQFGSVGTLLDLAEQNTLHQLALDGYTPDQDFLDRVVAHTEGGLSVLAAPSKFMPLDSLNTEQIAAILDGLRRAHDFVVVDLPHALGAWIEPVLKRADELVLVTDTSVPAIRHSRRLIEFFTQDNPDLRIEVVINREKKALFGSATEKEVQKALNRRLDHWLPDDPVAARMAADRGKPLSEVAPRSALTKAIARLAKETMQSFPVQHSSAGRGR